MEQRTNQRQILEKYEAWRAKAKKAVATLISNQMGTQASQRVKSELLGLRVIPEANVLLINDLADQLADLLTPPIQASAKEDVPARQPARHQRARKESSPEHLVASAKSAAARPV